VRADLEDREVGGRVASDDPRGDAIVAREIDLDLLRVFDHVVVRDDVAVLVDDEAGAEGGGRLRAEEGTVGDDRGRRHLHDRGRRLFVDLLNGLGAGLGRLEARGGRVGDGHRADDGLRVGAALDGSADPDGGATAEKSRKNERAHARPAGACIHHFSYSPAAVKSLLPQVKAALSPGTVGVRRGAAPLERPRGRIRGHDGGMALAVARSLEPYAG